MAGALAGPAKKDRAKDARAKKDHRATGDRAKSVRATEDRAKNGRAKKGQATEDRATEDLAKKDLRAKKDPRAKKNRLWLLVAAALVVVLALFGPWFSATVSRLSRKPPAGKCRYWLDCTEDELCYPSKDSRLGTCLKPKDPGYPCASDSDCVQGNRCLDGACAASSELGGGCVSDQDCKVGSKCFNGSCSLGEGGPGDQCLSTSRDCRGPPFIGGKRLYCIEGKCLSSPGEKGQRCTEVGDCGYGQSPTYVSPGGTFPSKEAGHCFPVDGLHGVRTCGGIAPGALGREGGKTEAL